MTTADEWRTRVEAVADARALWREGCVPLAYVGRARARLTVLADVLACDLTDCPECGGNGYRPWFDGNVQPLECEACAGTGLTIKRKADDMTETTSGQPHGDT